jgi:uncharacterized membrane protein YjjB (DUF3815 family)
MKLSNLTVKTFLAVFVVVFGMCAISFLDIKDMVLGALIGYIGGVMQYFFGASTGSTAKDKVISTMTENASSAYVSKEGDPPPPEPDPEDIGGGGIKNPKP